VCVESALCVSSNAGEDLVCGSGPHEGRGIFVVDHDIFTNGGFQLLYAAKYAAANPFVGELGEPAFNQIDPGTVGGSKVNVEVWALGEPLPDHRRFVSRVIVDDVMDHHSGRHLRFDRVQELAELQPTMTAMQLADDLVGLQLQRSKQ
jgi:hypothetical protein